MNKPNPNALATQCVRPEALPKSGTEPLVPPIDWSVVYKFRDLDHVDAVYQGAESGFVYARDGHPNASRLESQIARLEDVESAIVMGSGMGAEAGLFLGLLQAGDHVAIAEGLYGRTQVLVAQEMSRFGVSFSLFDSTRVDSLEACLTESTRLVFVETITNPLVRVPDLEALAACCKKQGAELAVDNTFAPVIVQPVRYGSTYVTHSVTKMIAGHSDATLGALAGPAARLQQIRPRVSSFGLCGSPFDCALALRGMATLPLRMEKATENAMVISQFLADHPRIAKVHYPGLKHHPDFALAIRQFENGFGTIATIDTGSREAANRLIQRLAGRIPFAPSLGDVATTLSHPVSTSHRGLTAEQRDLLGISVGLVRLSFGLEEQSDLLADFDWALSD